MEFFDLYAKPLGSLLSWLAKFETNITALQVVQGVAAVLGIILSTLGIYKAWRYAERRLGKRLDEFLESEEAKLDEARGAIRAIREQRSVAASDRPKLFTNGELQTALKLIGKRRYSAAKSTLNDTLSRTQERAELAHRKGDLHDRQRAITHLLLGALADAAEDHQTALIHFQSALEVDSEDTEAIEYLGFQYLRLGNAQQALGAFQKLQEIAQQKSDKLLEARALFFCGTAYEAPPNPLPMNANAAYSAAITLFPRTGPQLELARIYERRGLIATQLGFHVLANSMLMHALARYAEYERTHRRSNKNAEPTGTERVIAALKALEQIGNGVLDGDNGGSGDGNGASASLPVLG
jgi:tetratricopeptide (TPR) repeat protein